MNFFSRTETARTGGIRGLELEKTRFLYFSDAIQMNLYIAPRLETANHFASVGNSRHKLTTCLSLIDAILSHHASLLHPMHNDAVLYQAEMRCNQE